MLTHFIVLSLAAYSQIYLKRCDLLCAVKFGHLCLNYIDYILNLEANYTEANRITLQVVELLISLGLMIHSENLLVHSGVASPNIQSRYAYFLCSLTVKTII